MNANTSESPGKGRPESIGKGWSESTMKGWRALDVFRRGVGLHDDVDGLV